MGLLDEAIREHLDLKRRRGADPAEIERAEREALGPVRRGPEPVEAPDYDEPDWDEPLQEESGPFPGAFPVEPDEYEEPTAYHEPPPRHEPLLERDAAAHEEPLRNDEPADREQDEEDPLAEALGEPPPAAPAHEPRSAETAEYDVEEQMGKKGEDVLEETPEFLQDTPEHDRLWFEQRPPRDFDFNE
jgi:hypothetical protein